MLLWKLHAHAYIVTSRTTIKLIVLERLVKLSELVSNPFVFVYTIKYVQFWCRRVSVQGYKFREKCLKFKNRNLGFRTIIYWIVQIFFSTVVWRRNGRSLYLRNTLGIGKLPKIRMCRIHIYLTSLFYFSFFISSHWDYYK